MQSSSSKPDPYGVDESQQTIRVVDGSAKVLMKETANVTGTLSKLAC